VALIPARPVPRPPLACGRWRPARRLVQGMTDEQTIANLTAFAAELEARAAALELAAQTISHDEAVAAQRFDPDLGQS
jgi:hypothetical protein